MISPYIWKVLSHRGSDFISSQSLLFSKWITLSRYITNNCQPKVYNTNPSVLCVLQFPTSACQPTLRIEKSFLIILSVPSLTFYYILFYRLKWSRSVCPTSHGPIKRLHDCSLPGSSIHGIFQARILEWVATSFSICLLTSLSKLLWWCSPFTWTIQRILFSLCRVIYCWPLAPFLKSPLTWFQCPWSYALAYSESILAFFHRLFGCSPVG